MTDLCRIGVAISGDLLEKFDKLIAQRGYTNRSEAFRDLIRNELVQETWKSSDSEVFGTVTLVYDHHARLLPERLTELQHHYHAAVLSALHVHSGGRPYTALVIVIATINWPFGQHMLLQRGQWHLLAYIGLVLAQSRTRAVVKPIR